MVFKKLKDSNVLVTGANGFLGSWLTDRLTKKSKTVVALIRDEEPESNFYKLKLDKRVTVVRGDLLDYELILRALNEYEIDHVFHLAAQALVQVANRSPISTFKVNILGTIYLLEAARVYGNCSSIIVASSDKAYGKHKELPYKEDVKLNPEWPYDTSKACADLITRTYFNTYGLPTVTTRCANIYGGGDTNFSRIIPELMISIIEKRAPVIRSDGSPERDYIYYEDVVNAYITCAEDAYKNEVRGEAFNFGHNKPYSVLELVNLSLKIGGLKLKPKILGKAKGEIDKQFLDSTKARNILKWKPEFSLEQGLKLTLDWYKKNYKREWILP
ncbi:MAG TPA: NAD-dependent epimerase/dehydratase family protein [Firmicutes bacterium]|nr:NAD-dependent epimerase/dehydratase family protein [Bacillota bacterium]